jgi:hypothetical protein
LFDGPQESAIIIMDGTPPSSVKIDDAKEPINIYLNLTYSNDCYTT